ncbi:MAG: glycosyltransferase [Chitinophagaceae bacterium]|nr:MAG: glycosyltransferase [Chitinophagaceae bacterium]
MNYWILTTEFPPLFGGGISTYCYEAARMHLQHGDKVTVFIPDDTVPDYEIRTFEGIRVIAFNSNRSKLAESLGYIPRLSYEFAMMVRLMIQQEGKPAMIESQEYLAIAYYTLQFKMMKDAALLDVPVVLILHSPAFLYLYYNREGIYEFPNYWTGELEISCIRAADHVIAPSQYIVDEINKHIDLSGVPITVVRNPYRFTEMAISNAVKRNRIVFFGKLSPQKGVFEMFRYFKVLWDNGAEYVLEVVGGMDKVYYPEMKTMGQLIEQRYAAYIKRGLVVFHGQITPAQKGAMLADAHVVLIPSLNDNLPYAAIEAMGLGKLVLVSRQGGQAELIDNGVNGLVFTHEDPATFGLKLKEALEMDNETIRRIGTSAAASIRGALEYDKVYMEKMEALTVMRKSAPRQFFPYARPLHRAIRVASAEGKPGLLSVVIPYYNMGAYIDECVESVLQSLHPIVEVIIVNDGSTEAQSLAALQKWQKHPRITVQTKLNEGLAETRNYGARLASGEFLAFLDADDKVTPDYYSKAIALLSSYDDVSFVGSWVQFFGTKTNLWPTWNPEPPYILLHNSMNTSALVYKKQAFLAAGFNDKTVDYGLEDYGSLVSLLDSGFRGVVIPEPLFHYRIRPDSMYRSLTRYKAMYSHQYLAARFPDLYKTYAADIFNLMNANGPSFAYDNPSFGIRVTSTVVGNSGFINDLKMFVKRNPALKKALLQVKSLMKL